MKEAWVLGVEVFKWVIVFGAENLKEKDRMKVWKEEREYVRIKIKMNILFRCQKDEFWLVVE